MAAVNSLTNAGESVALSAVVAQVAKVALSKTAVNEDGTGITRPTAPTYADKAVTFGAVNTATDPTEVTNSAAVDFGDLEANETVTHWAGLKADNTVLVKGSLGAAVTFQSGVQDPLSFPVGALKLTLD